MASKKTGFFVFLFLFLLGGFSLAQEELPAVLPPVQSEYFKSETGGFGIRFESRELYYFLLINIVKSFTQTVFAEIRYENPESPFSPIIQQKIIRPEDKGLTLSSPPILGLKKDFDYEVAVLVYTDESKTKLLTEHKQKIKALVDQRYLQASDETLQYVLAGDYETAYDIFKWQKVFFKESFLETAALAVLDDFKKGTLNEDYVKHFFRGLSHHRKGDFRGGIEEFKENVSLVNHYPEGHMFLAIEYVSLGQGKEAIFCFEQCIKLRPNYAEAYWGMASAYMLLGGKDKAREYLVKARGLFELQENQDAIKGIDQQLQMLIE